MSAGPRWGGAQAEWADVFAERTAQQTLDMGSDGAVRISSHKVSGAAFRVVGSARNCFIQSSLPGDGQLTGLLGDAYAFIPRVTADRLMPQLTIVSELAREPTDGDEGWFAVARGLLQASRMSALERGAAQVQVRLWRQHRCYAVSCGDGPTAQVSSLLRLTVTASCGSGRGTASVADVPAASLTTARAAEAGRRAAGLAASQAAAVVPQSGDTAVVFEPEPAGVLMHEVVGHALEADVACDSPLWRTRESQATNPALTVLEDPCNPWAWEQVALDEEGTVCHRADLLIRGQVVGLMADRASASRLGVTATGHGRRGSYASPPVPRMRHTVTSAGPDSPSGILTDTRRGILVRAVDTADAVPGQGRFSLRVLDGCEIVNGVAGRSLTGFTVTGGLEDFRFLDAVGGDQVASTSWCGRQGRWLPVSHSAPTLRFPRLSVRGLGGTHD